MAQPRGEQAQLLNNTNNSSNSLRLLLCLPDHLPLPALLHKHQWQQASNPVGPMKKRAAHSELPSGHCKLEELPQASRSQGVNRHNCLTIQTTAATHHACCSAYLTTYHCLRCSTNQ
jgi:hypothetical protein